MAKKRAYCWTLAVLLAATACGASRQAGNTASAPDRLPMAEPVEVGLSQVPQQAKDSTSLTQKDPAPVSARPDSPSASQEEEAPSLADQVIAYARTFTGTPYKLGASGPSKFDCSGFTRYVFKKFGYELTQYSGAQFREGREVAGYSDLQKGDLVFFGKRGSVRNIGHVGIVVSVDEESGSFTFIHASVSNGVIEQSSSHPYFLMRYMGARRILPDEPRK